MYGIGVFLRRGACGALAVFLSAFPLVLGTGAAVPAVSASSAALYCPATGEFAFTQNADVRRGMASTTKIMTALVAIEQGDPAAEIVIPPEAVGVEGSSLYLKAGEKMTLRDLLYGLLLQSANDAAEAIAVAVGGSVEGFADLMNAKAAQMGLTDTHFTNPHGLADENHYTTARELAEIAAEAMRQPLFREICGSRRAAIPNGEGGKRYLVNHNRLLFTYAGAVGVKTGFTKATGRCLVSAAQRDGVELIAVTLGAPDDWRDHAAMLDYGFSAYERVTLAAAGQAFGVLPLLGGDEPDVEVCTPGEVSVVLPRTRGSIVERVVLNRPRFAPVYAADTVGRIVWFADGREIAAAPLTAARYVGRAESTVLRSNYGKNTTSKILHRLQSHVAARRRG